MDVNLELGRIVATPGALDALSRNGQFPSTFIFRHSVGDWVELSAHDWEVNEQAVRNGERVLSAYILKDKTKIWIITEADRSMTTILLPEDY